MNPTIETDLVGETVRVDYWTQGLTSTSRTNWQTVASGRVRAVTALPDGGLALWLEIVTEEDQTRTRYGDVNIGDIVVEPIKIGGGHRCTIVRSKA